MISLTNPTGRKTQAHVVTIGEREYFFSYQTCIGYRGPGPECHCGEETGGVGTSFENHVHKWGPLDHHYQTRVRIDNSWGPTTGRHFKELGCADFETVDAETFERIVEGSL